MNLVDLYIKGDSRFGRLYKSAQGIYANAFHTDEKEGGRTVKGYFDGMKAGEYGRDAFFYMVPALAGDKAAGMFSFDVLAPEEGAMGVMFDGYQAVSVKRRGKGIARGLFNAGLEAAVMHARSNGYEIKYVFGELKRPVDDEQKGKAKAVGRIRQGVVPVVEQEDGSYKVLYYAQPDLEKGAEEVPMMPVFSVLEDGQAVLAPPQLPAEEVRGVINRIMDSYSEAPYAVKEQIDGIRNAVAASIGSAGFLKMVPIAETIGMEQDGKR